MKKKRPRSGFLRWEVETHTPEKTLLDKILLYEPWPEVKSTFWVNQDGERFEDLHAGIDAMLAQGWQPLFMRDENYLILKHD